MLNYGVYDGDIIDIPKQYPYVQIIGAVKYPGLYSYSIKKTIDQYLNDAGGITDKESRNIFIIKPYSGQRVNYNDIKKIGLWSINNFIIFSINQTIYRSFIKTYRS